MINKMTNTKKPRHPIWAFLYLWVKHDSCRASHPDAKTYCCCFMFRNILFLYVAIIKNMAMVANPLKPQFHVRLSAQIRLFFNQILSE